MVDQQNKQSQQSELEIVVKAEPKKDRDTGDEAVETMGKYIDPLDEDYHVHSKNLRGSIEHQKHFIEDTPFHP